MDFIEKLPKSEGYDTIMVVVDRFSKYAHFFPLKHLFSAQLVAQVILDNVVKLHGDHNTLVMGSRGGEPVAWGVIKDRLAK